MSHITTVTDVEIKDVEAFVAACLELGLNVERNSTIQAHDGKRVNVLVGVRGTNHYGVGLVKTADGKLALTGDFQCFGWGMPAKMRDALKGKGSDKDIQNLLKKGTTVQTIKRLAAKQRMRALVTENPDGSIKMTLTR